MTRALTRLGSISDMRRQTANLAALQLIKDSCFLSAEANRHTHCREKAIEIMGYTPETIAQLTDDDLDDDIRDGLQDFAMKFFCRGASITCWSCGNLIPNGARACQKCGVIVTEPAGVLAKPEWETRLTLTAFEVAIASSLITDELMMYSIHSTARLLVLRNLLNQSENDHWKVRAHDIRQHMLDRWPDGRQPETGSWQIRFMRASAVFWLLGWPALRNYFSMEAVEKLFNTHLIKAVAVSVGRWADADVDLDDYGRLVHGIMLTPGINKEKAIRAISPEDLKEAETGEDARERQIVLHPPELLTRGMITYSATGEPWLVIPVKQPEVEILEARFEVTELSYSDLIAKLEEENEDELPTSISVTPRSHLSRTRD